MNTTTCNHTEAIALDLYSLYRTDISPQSNIDWDDLPREEQQAWIKVAGNLLPVLGQHALSDLAAYTKRKRKENSSIRGKILWGVLTAAVLAAASWLSSLGLTGCGHTIAASRQDGLIICKDGTCLIIKDGHITYGPQPQSVPVRATTK